MPVARAGCTLYLRCIAAALLFGATFSFHQRVCHIKTSGPAARHISCSPRRNAIDSFMFCIAPRPGGRRARRHQPRPRTTSQLLSMVEDLPSFDGLSAQAEENTAVSIAASTKPSTENNPTSPGGQAFSNLYSRLRPRQQPNQRQQQPQGPAHHDGDFLFDQKIESVKAALLCGGVGAASRLLAIGAAAVAPSVVREALAAPEPVASAVVFGLASGFVQGALFGLTYRYVVRADRQSTASAASPQMDGFTVGHLGDGCVAAFALTSAGGQSEVPLTLAAGHFVDVLGRGGGLLEALGAVVLPVAPFLPRAAGDLLLYSVTRTAIDRALDEGVIKPFP